MIDFIRTNFRNVIQENVNLSKYQLIDLNNAELKNKPFWYKGKIKCRESRDKFVVSGSLHTHFNDFILKNDKANTDDFSYIELNSCLDILANDLNVNWDDSTLTEVEFGLNIQLKLPVEKVIKSIKLHKKKAPQTQECNAKKCRIFFKYEDYDIKIYDKSKQYGLSINILRVEVRLRRDKFSQFGIYTPNHLKDRNKLKQLFNFLLQCWDELVVIDSPVCLNGLTNDEISLLWSGMNEYYWKERSDISRQGTHKQYKAYLDFIRKKGLNSTQNTIRELLLAKFEHLMRLE